MSTKRVYLIERQLSPEEEEGFFTILKQEEAEVFLSLPNPKLEAWGARAWGCLGVEQIKAVNERLLTAINNFGHTPVKKSTAGELLRYHGFPSWYYHKFRINFALQNRLHGLEMYKLMAETYGQAIVYIDLIPPLVKHQQIRGLLFITRDPENTAPSKPTKQKKSLYPQLKKMLFRFGKGAKIALARQESMPKHLFVLNNAHVRELIDPDNPPQRYHDNVFAGYFLRNYAHHFQLIDKLLFEKGSSNSNEELAEDAAYMQRNLQFNEWIEGTALLDPLTLWRVWRFHRHLKKSYSAIMRVLKDPLQMLIMQEFKKLHRSSVYFFFIYLAYRRYLKVCKFKSVTLFDEYSPNFRAIMDAAKQEGIRSNAIQHGSLAASNPGYGYSKKDAPLDPWPDQTLVWGQYWKELLIDIAAYPEHRLVVTGQIRTDVIPNLLQMPLLSEDILGIQTKGKFLILFATQPQPNEALRKRAALDMFAVAKHFPNAWIVLKPHPRERDATYYHALASEAGCSNYSIHYDEDLFLLLRLCQVLVHCYSTVGVEAVYFGMPAIILDYLAEDLLRFASEGVALQAKNREDLEQYLGQVARGECVLEETTRQAYIQKYACAIDGKVSERTAQALLTAAVPEAVLS